jgi:hypothetical protein
MEQVTSKERVLPKTELEWIAYALNDAAVALPVLFTMLAKIGAREGAMVADEILGHVKCAQKQCSHLVEAERRASHEPRTEPPLGFGIPVLRDMVRERMRDGLPQEEAIMSVARHAELRSEAIEALRASLNRRVE